MILGGEELHAPLYLFEEVEKHWPELVARSGVPESALLESVGILRDHVKEHGPDVYADHLDRAMGLLEDLDARDAPYVALAFALGADGLWSEDRRLSAVRGLRVLRTRDLVTSER